ncbi:MAG: hypothetical protein C0582_05340 [Alphaproteobacteria bacterium]|nr:MAG: hypothetical protein C0582_05340 [Alphaproteobacteria bacterium]
MGCFVRAFLILGLLICSGVTTAKSNSNQHCSKVSSKHPHSSQHGIQFGYGNPKAKIHVTEYSSMACGACGYFKKHAWPEIKKHYIKTGKVYWVVKPYVFSKADLVAAQLSHCSSTNLLFEQYYLQQSKWLAADDPEKAAEKMARKYGLSQKEITQCLAKESIEDGLIKCRLEAGQKNIEATPTFIIGNTKVSQAIDFKEFSQIVTQAQAYLKKHETLQHFFVKIDGAEKLVKAPRHNKKKSGQYDRSSKTHQSGPAKSR